jgi:tetratricopeptide (TPR) repeat protein
VTVRGFGLLSVVLALAPLAARAQESGEVEAETPEIARLDQASLDKAEVQFFQGLAHYRAGRFEQAAVAFQEAYVLTKHRDLLFNVARSRERLGDKPGAIQWYQAYLATQPADETAVIHHIRQLGGEPGAPPAQTPAHTDTPVVEKPSVVEEGPGPWPWVAAGTSLAALAAGTVLGLQALDEASTARSADTRSVATKHKDAAESKALVADVAFGVSALAAAAAVYLWWQADAEATSEPHVEVGVVPGVGVGIGWGGAF